MKDSIAEAGDSGISAADDKKMVQDMELIADIAMKEIKSIDKKLAEKKQRKGEKSGQ